MSRRSRALKQYKSYREANKLSTKIMKCIRWLILFFIVYHLISLFLLASFQVSTPHMEPTLENNNRIIALPFLYGRKLSFINRTIPGFTEPVRGDIVTIANHEREKLPFYYPLIDPIIRFFTLQKTSLYSLSGYSDHTLMYRIIGIPGDTIYMEEGLLYVKPHGRAQFISEQDIIAKKYSLSYSKEFTTPKGNPYSPFFEPITLDDNTFFVIGDNRNIVTGSQLWGPIDRSIIISRVVATYWPKFVTH